MSKTLSPAARARKNARRRTPEARVQQAAWARAYRARNPEETKERNRIASRKRFQAKLEIIRSLKKACLDCEETHPARSLHFHHRDPSLKSTEVSNFLSGNNNMEAMMAEIAKCDVLCSKCHRKRHLKEKQMPEKTIKAEE